MSNHGKNVLWPPEHDNTLAELLKQFSYRVAAEKMNAKFGTSYTSSAISGRLKRLGKGRPAIAPDPIGVAARKKAREERANARRRAKRQSGHSDPPRIAVPPREQTVMRCAEIDPLHISLLDLKPEDCRWPYGDRDFTFCGHPQLEGSSYCGAHFFLSIGRGTISERAADRVAKSKLQGVW